MENNVKHLEIEYNYALQHYKQKKFTKAHDSLLKVIELKPNHDLALLLLGKIHEKVRNEPKEALLFYKGCKLPEAKLREGLIFEEEENYLLAASRFQNIIKLGSENGNGTIGQQQLVSPPQGETESTSSDVIGNNNSNSTAQSKSLKDVIADAYFHFGRLHEEGKGVLKDAKKAIEYYKKSATAASYYNLGVYFEENNLNEALLYYEKAAQLGDADAIYNLAILYDTQKQDPEKALHYYEKAAEKGSPDALYNLAVYQDKTLKDKEKAREYYEKAVELGHADSMYNLALMFEDGELSAGDEKTTNKRARELYMQAAKLDHAESLYNLGCIYDNGTCGVKKNSQKAFIYYEKAANHSHKDALFNLGCMYRDGQGMEQPDLKKALKYFKKAHEQGHDRALVCIGTLIYSEKDLEKIRKEKQGAARKKKVVKK